MVKFLGICFCLLVKHFEILHVVDGAVVGLRRKAGWGLWERPLLGPWDRVKQASWVSILASSADPDPDCDLQLLNPFLSFFLSGRICQPEPVLSRRKISKCCSWHFNSPHPHTQPIPQIANELREHYVSVGVNIMCGSAALSDNWTCFCCRQERRSRAVQKHPTTFSEHSLLARANAVAAASHQVQRLGKIIRQWQWQWQRQWQWQWQWQWQGWDFINADAISSEFWCWSFENREWWRRWG